MTRFNRAERIAHMKEKFFNKRTKAFVTLIFAFVFISLVLLAKWGFQTGNWAVGIIALIITVVEFLLGIFFLDLVWHQGD